MHFMLYYWCVFVCAAYVCACMHVWGGICECVGGIPNLIMGKFYHPYMIGRQFLFITTACPSMFFWLHTLLWSLWCGLVFFTFTAIDKHIYSHTLLVTTYKQEYMTGE
jgi:hypothetical protein